MNGASEKKIRLERPPRAHISIETTAVVSSLPRSIAERMLKVVRRGLESRGWSSDEKIIEARGPQGTYVFIRVSAKSVESQTVHGGKPGPTGDFNPSKPGPLSQDPAQLIAGGFTGLGERRKPAEKVAEEAVAEALAFLESNASIDSRLADQLLLPAVLAGWDLEFTTNRLTGHLRTNAETIALFLGPRVLLEEVGRVRVLHGGLR